MQDTGYRIQDTSKNKVSAEYIKFMLERLIESKNKTSCYVVIGEIDDIFKTLEDGRRIQIIYSHSSDGTHWSAMDCLLQGDTIKFFLLMLLV
jgi:hypothetical protein